MERRSYPRMSTKIDARFFYGNLFYSGTVSNISQLILFFDTQLYAPDTSFFAV